VRRALLISTCFPPIAAPEAVLSCKRMGNMPGWETDVVTIAPIRPADNDRGMSDYAAQRFRRIERVAPPWPARLPLPLTWPLFRLPDPVRGAVRKMVARAEAFGLGNYQALVSWSHWLSSHLAAFELKRRRPELPWLAHFSDPWADNPYNRYGPLLRSLNRRMERQVLAAADALTFTNQETVDLMLGKAPPAWRRKAHILPHAFDPDLYPPPTPRVPGLTVARHVGYFYGSRSPRPLCDALLALLQRAPAVLDNLMIELIGGIGRGIAPERELAALPPGLVQIRQPVDYRQSLALMRGADLLISIDAPAETSVFLPSKLIDYIGSERPILAITPRGAAAMVIDEIGGWRADPRDVEAIATALEQALAFARTSGNKSFGSADVRARYSIATLGRRSAELMNELVATKGQQA
jgi:glycosyltransferase involved in cell wall biosynthesis